MLTAGQLQAIAAVQINLQTLETHAKSVNALVSAQRLPIAWLVISDRTRPYLEAIEHLLAENEKDAHAAAARAVA